MATLVLGVLQRRIYYLKWKLLSFAKVKWAFWLSLPIDSRWYEKMVPSTLYMFYNNKSFTRLIKSRRIITSFRKCLLNPGCFRSSPFRNVIWLFLLNQNFIFVPVSNLFFFTIPLLEVCGCFVILNNLKIDDVVK